MNVPQELFDQREELIRELLQYWFAGEASLKHEAAGLINRRLRALDEEWQRNTETPDDLCRCCPHCTAILRGDEEMQEHLKRWHQPDPLVLYIMRHFDDIVNDKLSLRNRAESAIKDYEQNYDHGKMEKHGVEAQNRRSETDNAK